MTNHYSTMYIIFKQIIIKDLYRHGDFKTADSFIQESGIIFDQKFKFIFNDLNEITNDLKEKQLDSLINWCIKYKTLLDNMKSNLHFEALKLKVLLSYLVYYSF
jgi:hypothetical protein